MYFDSHVHCRDEQQSDKDTIINVLRICGLAGVDGICDMPNTKIPITTEERILRRFEIADSNSDVFYGLYIGLTPEPSQIEKAIELYHRYFPKPGDKLGVIGFKLYAGETTGNLEIPIQFQKNVYEELSKNNFTGIVVAHCGRKDLMMPLLWDPSKPYTHSDARPIKAKLSSIEYQAAFAIETSFSGKLHIAHVSSPEEVELISRIRQEHNLDMTCEITPDHLFLYNELMNGTDGLLLKANPPLRDQKRQQALLQQLREGKINWIATDHAPHTRKEKLEKNFSGTPGIDLWPRTARRLESEGFTPMQISDLTFYNSVNALGLQEVVRRTDNPGDPDLNEYTHLRPFWLLEKI
jgi:dihydroorotase